MGGVYRSCRMSGRRWVVLYLLAYHIEVLTIGMILVPQDWKSNRILNKPTAVRIVRNTEMNWGVDCRRWLQIGRWR